MPAWPWSATVPIAQPLKRRFRRAPTPISSAISRARNWRRPTPRRTPLSTRPRRRRWATSSSRRWRAAGPCSPRMPAASRTCSRTARAAILYTPRDLGEAVGLSRQLLGDAEARCTHRPRGAAGDRGAQLGAVDRPGAPGVHRSDPLGPVRREPLDVARPHRPGDHQGAGVRVSHRAGEAAQAVCRRLVETRLRLAPARRGMRSMPQPTAGGAET